MEVETIKLIWIFSFSIKTFLGLCLNPNIYRRINELIAAFTRYCRVLMSKLSSKSYKIIPYKKKTTKSVILNMEFWWFLTVIFQYLPSYFACQQLAVMWVDGLPYLCRCAITHLSVVSVSPSKTKTALLIIWWVNEPKQQT